MEPDLITQGLELMLFGMGTVIVFLTLLVFATRGMSSLVMRFTPPPPVGDKNPAASPTADGTLLAVITAAIHKHRSRR